MPTPSPAALCWLRSERDYTAVAVAEDALPADLTAAAAALGLAVRTATVDDVVVSQAGDEVSVSVRGERVDPREVFFHTGSLGRPAQAPDTWRLLSTVGVLEAAGFMVTVPAAQLIAWTDTIVPMLRFDPGTVRALPSVRLCTREIEVHRERLQPADWGLEFPVAVRPAVRRPGDRVFRADSDRGLTTLLQLAGASELTILVQPWLGEDVIEHIVVCVDGEPVGLDGTLAERLSGPAKSVAADLGLAYVRIGFVELDGELRLSHLDCTGFAADLDADALGVQLAAYREAFHRFRTADSAASASALGE
jgi:hypothetical protein